MHVVKRDGRSVPVMFDKITARVKKLCYEYDPKNVDAALVAQKTVAGLHDGVSVVQIDELAAETAAYLSVQHPDYSNLAARLAVSNLQKQTSKAFSSVVQKLYENVDSTTGEHRPIVSKELYEVTMKNKEKIDDMIVFDRDFDYDYFGYKTLERSYLARMNRQVCERPQHMLMRVAIGIHGEDIESAFETYDMMSKKFFTHATPTMFNAGTPTPQMSSCFLFDVKEDSIDGIFETLHQCALISKQAGGIGISMTKIRSSGSLIHGSGGIGNGLVPMLRVYDATARYVDQGGGKRKGAFAIYIEPWHADIHDFLDLRKNHGKDEHRARDLFYALWIPDLFMKRVEANGDWTLFCPTDAKGLDSTFGTEFEELYLKYEAEGRGRKSVRAQDIWYAIVEAQIETGVPYVLFKDAANRKSNQQNLGTIRCSNLCTEIIEFTSPDEIAVCNLASIALPKFVSSGIFDFETLVSVTRMLVRNLNLIIDRNYYPVDEARRSNMRHRPIGIGVQGLADVFILMGMPYESPEARKLNRDIFETIYFAALSESNRLAKRDGRYETFEGSPASKGVLQFDMWGVDPTDSRHPWTELKAAICANGLRNSLLMAPMPTASTAQILGNNECFEPYTSNLYSRRVLAGEFAVVNKHLFKNLMDMGLWTAELRDEIVRGNGSIQHIDGIPDNVKELYKTAWEMSMRSIIDMAADRGAFICQSQSLNLFCEEPTYQKLTSMHFYAWKKGLKTGMYYLRTRPAAAAVKFTLKPRKESQASAGTDCTDDVCTSCGA